MDLRSWIKPTRKIVLTMLALYLVAMLLNAGMQTASMGMDYGAVRQWIAGQYPLFFMGSFIFFFLLLAAASIVRNVYGGTALVAAVTALTGTAVYQKMKATGEPLFPWDLLQLKNAGEMASMTRGMFSPLVIVLTLVVVGSFGFLVFELPKLRFPLVLRVVFAVCSITGIFFFVHIMESKDSTLLNKISYEDIFWDQKQNYQYNGFVIAFASNLTGSMMAEPDGYSKEAVEAIAAKYASIPDAEPAASPAEAPNIVFVMNEAFFDLTRVTDYKLSEDPLPFLHEASKTKPSGYVLSPEFGGSTANVEFEALTGLTNYFLNDGSVPFQQNLTKQTDLPSIVSILKQRGYAALALHPFDKTFYSRNTVYPMLGFEKFTSSKEMPNREYLSSRSYVSDMAAMKEAVRELKEQEKTGKPAFLHLVTMQNHFPYTNKTIHGMNTVRAAGVASEYTDQVETYAEGIKHTDGALSYLSSAIQQLGRPTVVILWGDHLPGLPAKVYDDAGWTDERLRHETPLLVLSNYEVGSKPLGTLSPSFIGPEIFSFAGQKLPAYYKLLHEVKTAMPGLNKKVLLGPEGKVGEPTAEQQALLDDYKMIQYDLLEGKGYAKESMFD